MGGSFKKLHPGIGKNVLGRTVRRLAAKRLLNKALQLRKMYAGCRTVCRLAAKRLLNKALQLRKMYAGCLLKDVRSTPPIYQYVKRFSPVPINETGDCVVHKRMHTTCTW